MKFGLDRFLEDSSLRAPLAGKRVALLAHPASVTAELTHSLDALAALPDITLTRRFRPAARYQRRQARQYDGIARFHRPAARHPDLQPLRGSTPPNRRDARHFRCAAGGFAGSGLPHLHLHHHPALRAGSGRANTAKRVWVLDRPNPAGRPVEGLTLRSGWESFVGAGAMPMRHGLTMGELGLWFIHELKLDVDYRVIAMQGWQPDAAPGYGWPLGNVNGSTPAPTPPTCQWHVATPER